MTSRHWFLGVFCLGLAGLPLACGVTELLPESFMLQISSEAPLGSASLDRVRVLFAQESEAGVVRFPEVAEDGDLQVGADFDPVQRAEVIAIRHDGATFDLEEKVLLVVSGLGASGDVLTRYVGEVDLERNVVMPVRLVALVAGWIPNPFAFDAAWRYPWRADDDHRTLTELAESGASLSGEVGERCLREIRNR